ncbi:MAG: nitrogen fixation protein NifX [Gammaproteobacteria bacterium]|nr:nitrogen fixation protein NifX [Gammaproteobacteria bacterium]
MIEQPKPAGTIRAACASHDDTLLDGHFGSCEIFHIYEISATGWQLAESRMVAAGEGDSGGEDRIAERVKLISDCQLLFVISIGGPAAAKVVRAGVHPVKVPKVVTLEAQMASLQQAIADNPPPWLAKIMGLPLRQGRPEWAESP